MSAAGWSASSMPTEFSQPGALPSRITRPASGVSAVRLAAEPNNRHDEFAVRVEYRGEKIGYLPRDQNQPIARMLRARQPLRAYITTVDGDAAPWRAVKVRVRLAGR